MESLARLVVAIMVASFISGPIAILLSRVRTNNLFLKIFRRVVQFLFVLIGFWVGTQLLLAPIPLGVRLVGLFSIVTNYIALRREYFPTFFLLDYFKVPIPSWIIWNSPRGPKNTKGNPFGDHGNGPKGQS